MIADAIAEVWTTRKHASDDGWSDLWDRWSQAFGTRRTKSGVVIDEQRAQTFSAVWCATRIISEGVAGLPLALRKYTGDMSTELATDHPLYDLLSFEPNGEQDKLQWFDMQVPFQVNSGNAYAEIQRDRTGKIVGLWPIHPSRIPPANIVRGPVRTRGSIDIGDEGEIVYLVRNNDGTTSPIPKRDMLHVPGVMSENGITGKSLVEYAAESLGIIAATEQHVGAFYRNGATPDIVIRIPSTVPKEERENLRLSWQQRQGGTDNAHKALILIGDSDAKALGFNPEQAQLIDGRKFGIAEVSRFWRVPLHMLSELDGAKYDNVEVLNIQFVSETLQPWLQRWEFALRKQLLTQQERKEYLFKFNLNGRLRGDSRARGEWYEKMHGIGALSINEIRENEDLNPIEGGDRYFIKANNLVPLDRIDDIALLQQGQQQPDQPDDNADDNQQAERHLLKTAMRGLIGYEARAAVRAAAKPETFGKWLDAFYGKKFGPVFLNAMTPVAKSLGEDVHGLLFAHANESKTSLNACMDVQVSEFAAEVQRTVDAWKTRYEDEQ